MARRRRSKDAGIVTVEELSTGQERWWWCWVLAWIQIQVPLTGGVCIGLAEANVLISAAQVREKGLKIIQYVLKVAVLILAATGVGPSWMVLLAGLAGNVSIARRFFKFFRWLRHFEDVKAASCEPEWRLRNLMYVSFWANLGADIAEDVCSLERIGALPKGTLPIRLLVLAELFQLVLAITEIFLTLGKISRQQRILAKCVPSMQPEQSRKMALVQLELVKFISDIGKALYDCQFECSNEVLFTCCGLLSACISTHKFMVKVLVKKSITL